LPVSLRIGAVTFQERRLDEIEGSRSWKVTAPIRKVTGKVRPS